MTKEEIRAVYAAELARLKEGGESGASLLSWACKGTRTRVHAALQEANAAPGRGAEHEEYSARVKALTENSGPIEAHHIDALVKARVKSDDVHHERQKAHFTALWKQADEMVAAAGITEGGA